MLFIIFNVLFKLKVSSKNYLKKQKNIKISLKIKTLFQIITKSK